jgi:hypothetical protein
MLMPCRSPLSSVAATLAAALDWLSRSQFAIHLTDATKLHFDRRVAHSLWPEGIVLPQMAAGAGDSSYTREAGLPSYGIDGMFDDLDDARSRGRDERIGVRAFADEIQFTYRLMRQLSAGRYTAAYRFGRRQPLNLSPNLCGCARYGQMRINNRPRGSLN